MKNSKATQRILPTIIGSVLYGTAFFASAQVTHLDPYPLIDIDAAILAGNGCTRDDSYLDHYQISGSRSVIDLSPSHLSLSSTGSSKCLVRIPIEIPAGYKLKVERHAAYGYADLSDSARSAISIRTEALSPVAIQTRQLPAGGEGYFSISNRVSDTASGECSTESRRGLFKFDISANLMGNRSELEVYRAIAVLKLESCE